MEKLYSPATVRRLMEQTGFRVSKSLGQNFLVDGNLVEKIVEGAGIGPNDLVIEVGPGIGVLTDAAARRAGRVVGIELDRRLLPILAETLAEHTNVAIRNEDILQADLAAIVAGEKEKLPPGGSVKLIANLPYYITTPILMGILESDHRSLFESFTVMMQKEVGDRIRALPGTKAYGALTVAVAYYCEVDWIAHVPRDVFLPKPQVDSIVLRFRLRAAPGVAVEDPALLFQVVKAGFGQRRKTLGNALATVPDLSKEAAARALALAGIDPGRRAETLTLQEFGALANAAGAILHEGR